MAIWSSWCPLPSRSFPHVASQAQEGRDERPQSAVSKFLQLVIYGLLPFAEMNSLNTFWFSFSSVGFEGLRVHYWQFIFFNFFQVGGGSAGADLRHPLAFDRPQGRGPPCAAHQAGQAGRICSQDLLPHNFLRGEKTCAMFSAASSRTLGIPL